MKIWLTLISLLILSCASEVQNMRQDGRNFGSSDMFADDEDGDSLVLPTQTTGSFLTWDCKWMKREGYADNQVACRFEGEKGRKAISSSLDLDAYSGDTLITKKVDMLPVDDFWNAIITIDRKYTENVDVAYFLSGKEQDRKSVDMMLLNNKGIMSVREVEKFLTINPDELSEMGVDLPGGSIVDVVGGVISATGGIRVELGERSIHPGVLCERDGSNKLISAEEIAKHPELGKLGENYSDYYWDYKTFYTSYIRGSDSLLGGLGPELIESYIEKYVYKPACNFLEDSGSDWISRKCKARPEDPLPKPILNMNGFCLKKLAMFKENVNGPKYYCDVAVFDKKAGSEQLYYMGLGKDRLEDINSDLKANSTAEALKMYLQSFDKCDGFEEKDASVFEL